MGLRSEERPVFLLLLDQTARQSVRRDPLLPGLLWTATAALGYAQEVDRFPPICRADYVDGYSHPSGGANRLADGM